MGVNEFRKEFERVATLERERRYGEALRIVDDLLRVRPYSSELLVQRAMLQQLDSGEYSLDDIERDLREAQALSPSHATPLLELGHFLYAVRDQAHEALECFQSARGLAATALREALIGEVKCHLERRAWREVEASLGEAERLFPGDLDLGLLRAEYGELAGDQGAREQG